MMARLLLPRAASAVLRTPVWQRSALFFSSKNVFDDEAMALIIGDKDKELRARHNRMRDDFPSFSQPPGGQQVTAEAAFRFNHECLRQTEGHYF
jgi:hypothetical protein